MGLLQIHLCFVFVIFSGILSSCQAYTFYVGGKDGWVLNPSENYNHWAERNRFQVNDTLIFKYQKGNDSVLVVDKDDYYTCNKSNPIQVLEDGESKFKFDRSGPFFFISGHGDGDHCKNGQKLIIVVLAVRHKWTPPSPIPPPSLAPVAVPPMSPPPRAEPPQSLAPELSQPPMAPSAAAPVSYEFVSLVMVLSFGVLFW